MDKPQTTIAILILLALCSFMGVVLWNDYHWTPLTNAPTIRSSMWGYQCYVNRKLQECGHNLQNISNEKHGENIINFICEPYGNFITATDFSHD